MAINLGDIVFGLGADTSRLRTALRDILDFGDSLDTLAATSSAGTAKIEADFRKQEAAIVSAMQKMKTMNDTMRNADAPAFMVKRTQDAFKEFTQQMTAGVASPLEYQRAMERFRTELFRTNIEFKNWQATVTPAVGAGSKFADLLNQLARGASLATGPLSGVAARLNILSSLIDTNTLHLALFVAGIAGAAYLMVKLGESTIHAEMGLLRTKLQLTALSGNAVQAQVTMSMLLEVANQFGAPFEDVAAHFAKLEVASRGTKLEGSGVISMFKELIAATTNMGATQNQTDQVLNLVTVSLSRQRLAVRDLRGEFTRVIPNATQIAANAITGGDVGAFDILVKRGLVIAQDFWPKFFAQMNKMNGTDITRPMDNLFSSQGRFANSQLELNNAFNQALGITDSYKSTLDKLTKAFLYLSQHMTTVIPILGMVGGAFAGIFTSSLITGIVNATVAIATMTRALFTTGIAAAFATGGLSALLGAAGVIVGGIAAYKLLDSSINKSTDSLLGSMPTMEKYIASLDKTKKSAAAATAEVILFAKANEVAPAQKALAEAEKTYSEMVKKAEESGAQAADSWWTSFLKYMGDVATAESGGVTYTEMSSAALKAQQDVISNLRSKVEGLSSALAKLQAIQRQQAADEKAQQGAPLEKTQAQIRIELLYKEIAQFSKESNQQFEAMREGPAALQDALEKIQIEKTIESWHDKFTRAAEEYPAFADKMKAALEKVKKATTDLADAKLFDKKFVSFGQELSDAFNTIANDGLRNFITAVNNGTLSTTKFKDLFISALTSVETKIIQLAALNPIMNSLFGTTEKTLSLFGGGTGTGGLIGNFLSKIGLQPGGGTPASALGTADGLVGGFQIQHGGSGTNRYGFYDQSIFAGASRYHGGLQGDEFPAILQDGETVLPKGMGAGGGSRTEVNVYNYADNTSVQTKKSNQGGVNVTDVIIATTNKAIGEGRMTSSLQRNASSNRPITR